MLKRIKTKMSLKSNFFLYLIIASTISDSEKYETYPVLRPKTPNNLSEKFSLFKISAKVKKNENESINDSPASIRELTRLKPLPSREIENRKARKQIRISFGGVIGSRV